MVASLRPGGWVLVEDFDSDIAPEAFPSPRSADEELGNRVARSIRALLAQRGADTAFGHKLPRLLGDAGLEEIGADAYQAIEAGDAIRRLQHANIRQVGTALVEQALVFGSRARAVRGPARRTQGEPELAAARVGVGAAPGQRSERGRKDGVRGAGSGTMGDDGGREVKGSRKPMSNGEQATSRTRRIAIIGAGPGGLCMAIKLREAGIDDFVILERAPGVGGTWYHNTLPGLRVRHPVRSSTRSRSSSSATGHAPVRHASRRSSPTSNTASTQVRARCRTCGSARRSPAPDGTTTRPLVARSTTDDGERSTPTSWSARSACSATSTGPTSPASTSSRARVFHSARWDHDHDLTGERGGGDRQRGERRAVRARDRAARSRSLHLFQRTPQLGAPEGRRRPYTPRSSSAFRTRPRRGASTRRQRDLRAHRRRHHVLGPGGARAGRAARRCQSMAVVRGPGGARASSRPTVPVGLQAPAHLERVLPDVQPPERRARHRRRSTRSTPDAVVTADGVARDRRHDHPRHRLRDHKYLVGHRRDRPRRPPHRRRLARRRAGVPRRSRPRASRTSSCCTARTPTTARSSA